MTDRIVENVFAWHALNDACPKCRALNGKEWRNQDLFQNVLWDAIWGDIWDLVADHTLAHPNCRCQLEVRFEPVANRDVKQMLREAKGLLTELTSLRDTLRSYMV